MMGLNESNKKSTSKSQGTAEFPQRLSGRKTSDASQRSADKNRDLTVGDPHKVIWSFCLPLFASVVFQQIYNIADSLVAGRFIGEDALAAVGNSYEITLIFIAIAFGCNIGCSVMTSRLFGAKNYGLMKTTVYTALIASGILCLLLMGIGIGFSAPLLTLIRTPEGIFADSALYLRIYILGLPFLFFYNIATGIFSALGDSRTPFLFLAASSSSNILLDIVFVAVFKMGVAGVAWATFLCQGVSCLLAMVTIFRRLLSFQTGKVPFFSLRSLVALAVIAVPSMLQQSFVSFGNIIIQSIINSFGAGVIAGYAAAIKMNNLMITSLTTLGNGISNYTSQNLGAGKTDRIHQGFRAGVSMVWKICLPVVALYLLLAGQLIRFFISDPSVEAITSGSRFLYIVVPFYFVVSVKLVADGILRGAAIMSRFMISTFTDLILRVVLAWIFSGMFGVIGIWMAWPVGWCIATAMSVYFYKTAVWK